MDAVHALAAAGAPPGTGVTAREQTAGRGARGRDWMSPDGGLWLSVMLRPRPPASAELLSLRVGLAVATALAEVDRRLNLRLKWPNDLMLGECKAGGILCEARWQGAELAWVATGIGLNVANAVPADTRLPAARLADVVPGLRPDDLLGAVLSAVRAVGGGERLDDCEVAEFSRRDWLRGRALAGPIAGRAAGVAADGTLRVAGPGGERQVRTGPVHLASVTDAACC